LIVQNPIESPADKSPSAWKEEKGVCSRDEFFTSALDLRGLSWVYLVMCNLFGIISTAKSNTIRSVTKLL